jgi:hypothetical protein
MNNATHENAIHPLSAQQSNANNCIPEGSIPEEPTETTEVLHQLNQLRYNPRAQAIRNILKYSKDHRDLSKK